MEFYFAPLEGITTYIYRNAYQKYFKGIHKYYAPFIPAAENRTMSKREWNDIAPEHNETISLVPQLLTNCEKAFIKVGEELDKAGYREVNLNLGCPSKTVVAKGKGGGFLGNPEKLEAFLDGIFTWGKMEISIKTRLGMTSPDEFSRLLELFNRYPVKELIIHPRVQTDYYNNLPNLSAFGEACKNSKIPVCYNGNLFTRQDYETFQKEFPKVSKVMLGRGLIANPSLIEEIQGTGVREKELWQAFHEEILTGYEEALSGDRNVLFKMKELWLYLLPMFEKSEKLGKKIRKCSRVEEYRSCVREVFTQCRIKDKSK